MSVYDQPDELDVARFLISPPIRPAGDRDALWAGLADGSLSLVATDHVPDRLDREKAEATHGVPFDRISNGAPGIETLLTMLYSEGVAKGRLTVERLVDLLATTPARRFGLPRKGEIKTGFDADLVLFDPAAERTVRATDLHHTSDYTPYEGLEVTGAVRTVFVRGRAVIRDQRYVGERGWGRVADRGPIGS
jgi:dihydropyrimidinase